MTREIRLILPPHYSQVAFLSSHDQTLGWIEKINIKIENMLVLQREHD